MTQTGLLSTVVIAAIGAIKYVTMWFSKREADLIAQANTAHERTTKLLMEQVTEMKNELVRVTAQLMESNSAKHLMELRLRAIEHELNLFRLQCKVCLASKPIIDPRQDSQQSQ